MTIQVPPPRRVVDSPVPRRRGARSALAIVVPAAALAVAWYVGGWQSSPQEAQLRERLRDVERTLAERTGQNATLEERLAVATRADQVSREANQALERTLAEREEEISGLRADLEFYERLVGGSARQGLRVHEFRLRPIAGTRGFGFVLTLTQNLRRGAAVNGEVTVAIEGVRDGKVARLSWTDLIQDPGARPMPFAFKYFQRLDGSFVLPDGFTPTRVLVDGKGSGGETITHAQPWERALQPEDNDVRN